jgi:hypothetical protein
MESATAQLDKQRAIEFITKPQTCLKMLFKSHAMCFKLLHAFATFPFT